MKAEYQQDLGELLERGRKELWQNIQRNDREPRDTDQKHTLLNDPTTSREFFFQELERQHPIMKGYPLTPQLGLAVRYSIIARRLRQEQSSVPQPLQQYPERLAKALESLVARLRQPDTSSEHISEDRLPFFRDKVIEQIRQLTNKLVSPQLKHTDHVPCVMEGHQGCRILLVGDSPGSREIRLGVPFVDNHIAEMYGLGTEQNGKQYAGDILSNILKRVWLWRPAWGEPPPDASSWLQVAITNRRRYVTELSSEYPWLLELEALALDPVVTVALGKEAFEAIRHITQLDIGQFYSSRIAPAAPFGHVITTFHPAYLMHEDVLEKRDLAEIAIENALRKAARIASNPEDLSASAIDLFDIRQYQETINDIAKELRSSQGEPGEPSEEDITRD